MKKLILTIIGIGAVSYTCAGHVSAFKVVGITETNEKDKQQIVRTVELQHFRHISGERHVSGEKRELFNLTVARATATPFGYSKVIMPGPWFSVQKGETIVVFYKKGIENPSTILIGKDYVDDVEFVLSAPGNLDLAARQQRLDEYFRTHPMFQYDRLIGMFAQVVIDSGYDKELWMKYVDGNPLKMKNAAYTKFIDGLSCMLDDIKDGDGNGTVPDEVRKPKINLWISEFATQLGGDTYTDASARQDAARFLAKRYKKCRGFVTDLTQARIARLLSSDRISEENKKLFQ
jgi:hypothetical protein